jgi:hypothetical protein
MCLIYRPYNRLTTSCAVNTVLRCDVPIYAASGRLGGLCSRVQNCKGSGVKCHPVAGESSPHNCWWIRSATSIRCLTHKQKEVDRRIPAKLRRPCSKGNRENPSTQLSTSLSDSCFPQSAVPRIRRGTIRQKFRHAASRKNSLGQPGVP